MREISTDDVLFFGVVAKASSLTEAAREMGTSVSSVSKRLSRIERRLGVSLMTRTTRRLTLTSEGERYAAGSAAIAAELTELEDSLSEHSELVGRIRVHATVGLGRAHIAPLVAEFCTAHPRVQVELELSPLPLNIAGTTFDVGIRVGALQDSRLTAKRLHPNRRIVCASPEYLRRHGTPAEPKQLHNHNCIVLRENEGDYALWRFGTDSDETAIRVAGNLSSNDGDVITRWCVEGYGLIMRSTWHVAPLLREGALVQVLTDVPTPSADIHALYLATAHVPRRISSLVDHLTEGLARRVHSCGLVRMSLPHKAEAERAPE
ncbi:LysR family transcriptional regulator [Nocardia sp. NPDC052566]|uniref:LysR family transcriptional regulator n=1 Tax=Nocardia sp. NPDC052566 TaxID=3364330 RepID=UPI0037C6F9A1